MFPEIKYSIIIPFFNSSKCIEELLNSIPSRPEYEILVVDDKSDQNEAEELKRIISIRKDQNVTYYLNDRKKSAGTCRNIGVENAKGKWLIFADSDDYFTESAHDVFEKWYGDEADLIYFVPTSYVRKEDVVGDRHVNYEKWVKDYIDCNSRKNEIALKTNFVVPWSKMIKREVVVQNGILFDEVRASNDVMFSLQVAFSSQSFRCSTECIYCVTKNPGSLMYRIDRDVLDARLHVYIRQYAFLKRSLPADEFAALKMRGTSMLRKYILAKQPVTVVMGVFITLIKNHVKVFDLRIINLKWWKKAASKLSVSYSKDKKYYKK